MLKILKSFLLDDVGSTLAVTYSFSPNTLALSAQVNQNFQDVVAVVNALTSVNYASASVTAAKLNGDVVRATYGLIQHSDGSLYVDVSDTNPCLELTDGGVRVKVDGATIGRTSSGLSIVVPSEAQGDILYRGASGWVRLGAGTSGYFLQTQGAAANPQWAGATGAGTLGSFKNLKVIKTSASVITVTADELVLEDSSNNKAIVRSVNQALTITTAGAGGLDTGAEAGNTIYYGWIIRKSSDGTTAGLLSLSATAPTMPSGYDQKALVTCVGNDNSSNFIGFTQTGKKYCFTVWALIISGTQAPWASVDLTPANMSTNPGFVPSALSTFCWGIMCGTNIDMQITNDSSVSTTVGTFAPNKHTYSGTSVETMAWCFDVLTADTLYVGSAAAGSAGMVCYLAGFEMNKL